MNFYQFHIGDYRRQTGHLTLLEHAIYRALIDTYYLDEQPLSANLAKLMRSHSVRNADEEQALKNVLEDFFELTEDGYRHHECDIQLSKIYKKSEKARASAQARWKKNANAVRTVCEGDATGMLPNNPITQDPITQDNNVEQAQPDGMGMVNEVFGYWLTVMGKNAKTTKKTPERVNKIKGRLKQGYSVEDIKGAIDGCARSPFHMGENPDGKKYNDIELICRNGKHLEEFVNTPEYHERPVSDKDKRRQLTEHLLDINNIDW